MPFEQYFTLPRRGVTRVVPVLEREMPDITVMTERQSTREVAYFWLDREIQNTFCSDEKPSITDIYEEITRDYGLSWDDTEVLVRNAVKAGYLREWIRVPRQKKK